MAGEKYKILIAEDEKPMARALEMKLNHEGFEAKAVFNGELALESLLSEKFALVLIDLMMPKVDGFKVLETINEANLAVPVIVLSNLNQDEDEQKAKDLGAKAFFVKSNTPIAEIVNYVKKFLS